MIEEYINKFVVITFRNRGADLRTIAYVVEVKDGFVKLEAPAQKNQYLVSLSAIIEVAELPESQVRPEYRRDTK
jgi:hypothetical protein